MLGMGCVVPKKKRIEPYAVYVGNPANKLKENQYLIDKLGIDTKPVAEHKNRYMRAFNERFLK